MKTDEEIIEEFRHMIRGKSTAGRPPRDLDDMMDSFGCFLFGVLYAEGRSQADAAPLGPKLLATDWMKPKIIAHNQDVIATLKATGGDLRHLIH